MKILFVSSGNGVEGISPIVKNQAESLTRHDPDVEIDFFPVEGRGWKNYIKHSRKLSKFLKRNKYDLIHAHYALSGYVAALGNQKLPLVLSVMGSDAYLGFPYTQINRWMAGSKWDHVIVKSPNLSELLVLKNRYSVIPNGVDLEKFYHVDKAAAKQKLGLDNNKRYVLFASNPERKEKNFELAEKAFNKIQGEDLELLVIHGVSNDVMPLYFSSADVLLFTSLREGSPNVIKESMSCDLPLVSTEVGDVKWIVGSTEGCFLTSFDVDDTAENLKKALLFSTQHGRNQGRRRIKDLSLDSESVAKKIIKIYRDLVD